MHPVLSVLRICGWCGWGRCWSFTFRTTFIVCKKWRRRLRRRRSPPFLYGCVGCSAQYAIPQAVFGGHEKASLTPHENKDLVHGALPAVSNCDAPSVPVLVASALPVYSRLGSTSTHLLHACRYM